MVTPPFSILAALDGRKPKLRLSDRSSWVSLQARPRCLRTAPDPVSASSEVAGDTALNGQSLKEEVTAPLRLSRLKFRSTASALQTTKKQHLDLRIVISVMPPASPLKNWLGH